MRNILIKISYDGTDFSGWQRQNGQSGDSAADQSGQMAARTVQEELEKVLSVMHKQPCVIHGSGRTDAGVHAAGQIANFISPIDSIPAQNYIPALNSRLPRDIRILEAKEMPDSFHSRFSATSRTYRYFIHCGNAPFAHEMNYVWSIRRYPDIRVLNKMASVLSGEIDCTAFSAAGDQSPSKNRFLEKAVFYPQGEILVFEITANAFLWKMVRSITGSLLHYEAKGCPSEYFKEVLDRRERSLAGPTAPAHGLFLWNVSFEGIRRGPAIESE